MNRNQKIALGCGGAGCLGLIMLLVVGVVVYGLYWKRSSVYTTNRNSGYNINSSRNSNSSAPDSSTNSSDDSPSSSMSDDDKHRLFQAAGATQDFAVMQKVLTRIGMLKSDGSPSDDYAGFVRDHISWMLRNSEFSRTIDTPEKARAYVEQHIDD
jgi:hypothetical protein